MARTARRTAGIVAAGVVGVVVAVGGCTRAASGAAAGSAASSPVHSRTAAPATHGVLVVRMTLTGGPARRDGTMALNHSPARGQQVVARGATTVTAVTDAGGVARLTLAVGSWRVRTDLSPEQVVRVTGGEQRLDVDANVP